MLVPAPKKLYRARGLQWPLNASQLMVIFAHVSNAIVFYVAVHGTDSLPFTICMTTYSIICAVVVSCWFYTSMVDAALDATRCEKNFCGPLYCFKNCDMKTRYCAMTIGARNYAGFFSVILWSVFLFSFQCFAGIGMLTFWRPATITTSDIAWRIICTVSPLPCIGAYGTLLSFHLYLIKRQFGTYDYLIERAAKRRNARKQKHVEETAGATNETENGGAVGQNVESG
jgi:hypothetical protein